MKATATNWWQGLSVFPNSQSAGVLQSLWDEYGFNKVMYLVHPVLHELWIGAKGRREINHLNHFEATFIKLGRLVVPSSSTLVTIGRVCQRLRSIGRLNPRHPLIYNDVCIAMLARQIGATVVTENISDFEEIHATVDFKYRSVLGS